MNRPADQRKALVRNLVTSLFQYGYVKTTTAKAAALASEAEKLITRIKGKEPMNAIRELKKVIFTDEASRNALAFAQNTKSGSGYTRRVKLGQRAGDAAQLIHVELITNES